MTSNDRLNFHKELKNGSFEMMRGVNDIFMVNQNDISHLFRGYDQIDELFCFTSAKTDQIDNNLDITASVIKDFVKKASSHFSKIGSALEAYVL